MRKSSFSSVVVILALSLTACATPSSQRSKVDTPPNPWSLPQHQEHPLETERAMEDFVGQLIRACYAEVTRLNPSGLPEGLTAVAAIETCARQKLFRVADDPVGKQACGNKSALEELGACLMVGTLINRMRINVGSPTLLTESEWRDTELAQRNLLSEMTAQAYAQCTSGDSVAVEICQFDVITKSVGLPKKDVDYCMTRGNYAASCLTDKGVAKFIREASTRLWD